MSNRAALGAPVDRHTTRFTRRYPHPVDEVWRALTDPAAVDQWFIPKPNVDFRVGGRWWFVAPDDPTFQGTIDAYEPMRRIEYRYDNGSRMAFELEPSDGGSVLYFEHEQPHTFVVEPGLVPPGYGWGEQPGGPGTPQPALSAAWHCNLEGLTAYLDGAGPDRIRGAARLENEDPAAWRELVDVYRRHIAETTPPK